ncbi:hypothetical protein [Flexivirga sp. B27]
MSSELIAGYATYASTEAIMAEQTSAAAVEGNTTGYFSFSAHSFSFYPSISV